MQSTTTKKTASKGFKISARVTLPINTGKVNPAYVPRSIEFLDNKKTVEQVGIAVAHAMPVLLIGETGTGKTSLVRHIASKTGNAFVRVNHNGGTCVEDLVGRWIISSAGVTEWVDGILIEAMKNGYYFLADELNAASADINFVYHSLLDDDGRVVLVDKGNEVVIPHPNFRFFGAINPPAEYAGTKELNKALLSRFVVVRVDFPAPKTEIAVLVERTGIAQNIAEVMVKCAVDLRKSHASGQLRFVLSTRDLLQWAVMFQVYGRMMLSAESTVLNKAGEDDLSAVKSRLEMDCVGMDAQLAQAVTVDASSTSVITAQNDAE